MSQTGLLKSSSYVSEMYDEGISLKSTLYEMIEIGAVLRLLELKKKKVAKLKREKKDFFLEFYFQI